MRRAAYNAARKRPPGLKYESFLRAINASAYSQGRPKRATVFICPVCWPLPISIRDNFEKQPQPTVVRSERASGKNAHRPK